MSGGRVARFLLRVINLDGFLNGYVSKMSKNGVSTIVEACMYISENANDMENSG